MFKIQKAITVKEYMVGAFTKGEVIGFICMLGVSSLFKAYIHASLQFIFTLFILLLYIIMCLPVGAKDKKCYHAYLSFVQSSEEGVISYVEDKRMYGHAKKSKE
jgi:hypothetical protein